MQGAKTETWTFLFIQQHVPKPWRNSSQLTDLWGHKYRRRLWTDEFLVSRFARHLQDLRSACPQQDKCESPVAALKFFTFFFPPPVLFKVKSAPKCESCGLGNLFSMADYLKKTMPTFTSLRKKYFFFKGAKLYHNPLKNSYSANCSEHHLTMSGCHPGTIYFAQVRCTELWPY